MADESFLLVNLKEEKSKKLAQVLSNESCRKILEFLTTNKSATETEISEKLNVPLSTVHYNLKHLSKTGLVKTDEFHYSKKGREITHYTLANKYIIIAPSEDPSFMERLKKVIPFGIVSVIGTGILYAYQNLTKMGSFSLQSARMVGEKSMVYTTEDAVVAMSSPVIENATETAPEIITYIARSEPNLAIWFFFGTLLIILSMLVFEYVKSKKK